MTEHLTDRPKSARAIPFRTTAIAAAVAAGLGLSVQVAAQGLVLEEIVVTATKKQEVLSDVAETVNVFTGDRLQEFNVFNFSDLQNITPGLSMREFDPRNAGISLRGVPFDPDSNTNATVVVYWNGVSVRGNVAFNQMFDVKRVEVLRGPQGSLQGETSPSGSIQIYTNQGNPDVMEGNVRQTFSDNGESVTEAAVSIPVIEGKLGMRVAGVYTDNELYGLESVNNGKEATNMVRAGRLNFYFTPTDDLDASLTYEYLERFTDGLEAVEGTDQLGNSNPTLDSFDRTSLQEGSSDIKLRNQLLNLTVNWLVADHNVTWLTGYQNNLNYALRDLDLGNIFEDFNRDQLVNSDFEIWTQEIRFGNEDPEFWEYLFGVYYNESDSYTTNTNISPSGVTYNPGFGVTQPLVGSQSPFSPYGINPDLLLTTSRTLIPVRSQQFAVFTDNKFYLTEDLTLQVGLRWQERKQFSEVETYVNGYFEIPDQLNPPPATITLPDGTPLASGISDSEKDQKTEAVTGTIKLSYDFNEEWTGYVSYGRGNRAPGITISPTTGVSEDLLLYGEEESDSIEFGFKSVLDNGRYQVNGAVYYQTFKDFQNRSAGLYLDIEGGDGLLDTPILGGINYNADAIVKGAEMDVTAAITENWRGYLAVSYNDAKFDDASVPCGDLGEAADAGSQARTCQSDGRLGAEPNWSVSASSEYTVPELLTGIDGFVRGLYKFTGSRHDDFAAVNTFLYDGYDLPSYGVWDIYFGLRSQDDTWEVSLWSKNVFDKEAKTDLGALEVNSGRANFLGGPNLLVSGYSTVSVIPERTIGLTALYRFGSF